MPILENLHNKGFPDDGNKNHAHNTDDKNHANNDNGDSIDGSTILSHIELAWAIHKFVIYLYLFHSQYLQQNEGLNHLILLPKSIYLHFHSLFNAFYMTSYTLRVTLDYLMFLSMLALPLVGQSHSLH